MPVEPLVKMTVSTSSGFTFVKPSIRSSALAGST
jgi:hypothetical protein